MTDAMGYVHGIAAPRLGRVLVVKNAFSSFECHNFNLFSVMMLSSCASFVICRRHFLETFRKQTKYSTASINGGLSLNQKNGRLSN